MLIVALDVSSLDAARAIVESTTEEVTVFKVGLQLLTAQGPQVIQYLKERGKIVFLDLKLHEISNSVSSAVHAAGVMVLLPRRMKQRSYEHYSGRICSS